MRPYSKKVTQLVELMMSLSQEEANELCKLCATRMTPTAANGSAKFQPSPVMNRVPFPSPHGIFGGLKTFAGVRPAVNTAPQMNNLLMMLNRMKDAQVESKAEEKK
eukprot:GDKJ01023702.1.p2 GENE.GDKJ01023702.1~~GDKJ01023702.1.p2  ORF type:complete len:106 (+),score=24.00 GDKJ01023702.1:48-365(+)